LDFADRQLVLFKVEHDHRHIVSFFSLVEQGSFAFGHRVPR